MQNNKRPLRYDEFIFKLQFQRKVHPAVYMFSKPSTKVIGFVMLGYYFFPSNAEWIFAIGFYLLMRKYTDTQMTYKAKLASYYHGKEDQAIPAISFYSQKKEHYLKHQIKAKNDEAK
ncbi:MAG: hypothetical protein PHT07_10665 [Paludibacter sp.]|nr:hypothetical protein [Paludibacter sp.]